MLRTMDFQATSSYIQQYFQSLYRSAGYGTLIIRSFLYTYLIL